MAKTPACYRFDGRDYKARILIKSDGNLLVSGKIDSAFLNHARPRRHDEKTAISTSERPCWCADMFGVRRPKFLPVR
jgi:hypothetical protein